MRIKEIKRDALASLKGRWGMAILLTFIGYGIFTILPLLGDIMLAGGFGAYFAEDTPTVESESISWILSIALSPVVYSYYWTFLDMRRGLPVDAGTLFKNIKGSFYFKTMGLYFLTTLYTFLWALLLFVPAIIKSLAYSQAYFILKDNPGMVINDAITESRKLMDGFKGTYFLLTLSFIGWALLCVLTLGIGFIWLIPYYTAANASFYQALIEHRHPQTIEY